MIDQLHSHQRIQDVLVQRMPAWETVFLRINYQSMIHVVDVDMRQAPGAVYAPDQIDGLGDGVAAEFQNVMFVASYLDATGWPKVTFRFYVSVALPKYEPPALPLPKSVSDSTLSLLWQIESGADMRAFYRYRVPYPEIDGEPIPYEDWTAFERELTGRAFVAVPPNYIGRDEIEVTGWVLVDTENTYSEWDGVEDKFTLTDDGRAFLAKMQGEKA